MGLSRNAPTVLIVTPYLAGANNGNWRTAARWARLLSPTYRTIVQAPDDATVAKADVLIALHARRSRSAVQRRNAEQPACPLIVVLTGTDLYRDVPEGDAAALASLADADRLIVLQDQAVSALPLQYRAKTDVVYQSARTLRHPAESSHGGLRCAFVAHLRPEKDPATVIAAWALLPGELPITLSMIGDALDASLADAARVASAADRRIRCWGPRPHAWTRQAIKRADVLVCASRMEGGANVIVEAVTAGTPVVASRMSGNLGMLGDDYAGYFTPGDAGELAALLRRCHDDAAFMMLLQEQCAARAPLFSPEAERAALLGSVERARTT
ncbi:MAG: TIGR04348 family glycosyltransferase [Pseudomonadota bacterium]|nr:TIGR04348 family glycosyltransferase [Pseudomonadota bacterium]